MSTPSDAFAIAASHLQHGRLNEAEAVCRQVLEADPEQFEAIHLLGLIASRLGRHQEAEILLRQAIGIRNSDATFHSNLGAVLKELGKLDESAESCRRALALRPDSAAAHYNLGTALQEQGKLDEAANCFRLAIDLRPEYEVAHNNLGTVLLAQGKLEEAAARFRRTLELKPEYAEAHFNLGTARQGQGQLDEAVDCFRRAIALQPGLAQAHFNLAGALKALGNVSEAVASYRRVLELNPADTKAYNNLAMTLHSVGELDEAVMCLRRALAQNPADSATYSNLGTVFKDQGKFDAAVSAYRQAVALAPQWAIGHYNLGTALQSQQYLREAGECFRHALELQPDLAEAHNSLGTILNAWRQLDDAVAAYRRALECKPYYAAACSNLLLAVQYRPGTTPAELLAAHLDYDRTQAALHSNSWRPHANERNSQRRLRLGFVSRDFGKHPVGRFLMGAFENIDQDKFELVGYSDRPIKDELTRRFEAAATAWRDVNRLTDEQLAEQIRTDRIDILFDLAGHTSKNRLLVFARKPAPLQVTWAGYAGTTGLAAMDYILADRYEIPQGAEAHYRERVLRMPDGYVCFEPPADAPPVSRLPASELGYVTFGSFNNPAKITPPIVEVWAKVLKRIPTSRLILKYLGMDESPVVDSLRTEFAAHGVELQRVTCLGWSQHRQLLAEYGRIDLALDTFPYNGGLTTCEALWMGVPVITCPGETFASRHSLSHLSVAGLTEAIARDLDDYVERAAALATDLPRLATLRSELRQRLAQSPLCNGQRFAENLMTVLRDIWRQWCQREHSQ